MYALQVEGMSCSHCVNAVTRAVQQVDATAKVEIDLAAHTVRVQSTAQLSTITQAIVDAGYPVTGGGAG